MRIITKKYEVYKYNELSDDAKNKAMNNFIKDLIEVISFEELPHDNKLYKAYKECERMKTPWLIGDYIYACCKDELEEQLNEYEFLADGTYFN